MYDKRAKQDALDLWFSMPGEMSVDDFAAELGYPSGSTLRNWIKADPRHDPDKCQYRSKPVLPKLGEGEAPVAHTDRGCHYRWPGWKAICGRHGLARSMSRKGTSPDNAACEGFFGNLKNEFFHGRDWSGWTAEAFMELLDGWMAAYSTVRLKAFREGGRTVYDTIDNRRRRLGLAA